MQHVYLWKKEIVLKGTSSSDGPAYDFEIISSTSFKKLYFYSPHEKYGYCPRTNQLNWIINGINAFEKYLGN